MFDPLPVQVAGPQLVAITPSGLSLVQIQIRSVPRKRRHGCRHRLPTLTMAVIELKAVYRINLLLGWMPRSAQMISLWCGQSRIPVVFSVTSRRQLPSLSSRAQNVKEALYGGKWLMNSSLDGPSRICCGCVPMMVNANHWTKIG